MIYPKIYNNFSYIINKKTSLSIFLWIILLIISFIIFIIISLKYEYYLYQSYFGYVKKIDDSFYTIIYVSKDKINELSKSNLLVDNNDYSFEIVSISEEYFIIDNKTCYQVILDFDLKDEYKIENNIINIVLKNNKTTLYQELKKGIKKWKS